ncbi:thiol:disulfide interchange protein DsbA/DsbL [Chitinimonas arctica]|uniref:Thiol:disulfide interchange protein n=1 Tax=Chitinimonas arctica TaxID=2594795 RepID=A0A516SLD6_9NEIS|nr:thiol:disulfide interchange protein DsbA/DsbL [Chitinimonas arctica]QDQ28977.1 thiol:disulfide interchange protein DsbA/DsbL [Chitinimonas arctica]
MITKRMFGRAMLALGLALAGGTAFAAGDHSSDAPIMPLANPQPVETPGKIEVIEFFWYGCPHCYQVEHTVGAWEKTLPKDVVFRREHALWDGRSDMTGHAKLFITLRLMGLLPKYNRAVFDAVASKIELRDEQVLFDWVAKQGINRSQFEAAYKSFGIGAQLGRAKQLTKTYRIEGVPTFIINGKFVTSPHQAGSEQRMFALIDELIARERKAGKGQ